MVPTRALSLFGGYGVEAEYMIVDADTLGIVPVADCLLRTPDGTVTNELVRGPLRWSNEFVRHVVEFKTDGPVDTLAKLPAAFRAAVAAANRQLASHRACLLPTAMHPLMQPTRETVLWPFSNREIYRAYDRIFGCQGHGWSNLQSLHCNLPFNGDEEFGRLHAAVRLVLPLIPAVAASSPLAEGRATGCLDHRLWYYQHNQDRIPSLTGSVIPEPIYTEQAYREQILARLYRDIAPHDPEGILQEEWLNSRGAIARFDRQAVEIRLIDMQECPTADGAVLAALTGLVRGLAAEHWADRSRQQAFPTESLAALLRSTIREGERAPVPDRAFIHLMGVPAGRIRTAGQLWRELVDTRLAGLVDRRWEEALDLILTKGTLATRILDFLHGDVRASSIRECYRILADGVAQDRLFGG